MLIRQFAASETDSVVALWEAAGLVRPWNDPRADIERKLGSQPELFLVGEFDGGVVATVMAGFDGHRGWVHYLAVLPKFQRRGFGRAIMREVERRLVEINCVKLNLQVRSDNEAVLGFYRGLGFGEEQVISLGKRLTLS